jgi:hypothetical protein
MRIVSSKVQPNGTTRITAVLQPGEQLSAIDPNSHYKLPDPVSEVMAGHLLTEPERVHWCSATQAWI